MFTRALVTLVNVAPSFDRRSTTVHHDAARAVVRILNDNLRDDLIPSIGDAPDIVSIAVPSYEPRGPYGAKEVGEGGGLAVFREAEAPNGNLLDLQGRLLTCQHGARNIVRTEQNGSITVLADRFEGRRFNSPNDVAVKSDGTLWFTDPPWGLPNLTEGKELDGNWVYRLDPAVGEITAVIRDLAMPNGIAFSPDETCLYVADTGGFLTAPEFEHHDAPATLSAYEIDAGREVGARPVWRVETLCDGMCVDEQGNIYATGDTGVTVWNPQGVLLRTIVVPEQPANVCFGGQRFTTLFITARTSLYAVELEVAGNLP